MQYSYRQLIAQVLYVHCWAELPIEKLFIASKPIVDYNHLSLYF